MATADAFSICPLHRYRFIDRTATLLTQQATTLHSRTPTTGLAFRLQPLLAVDVVELGPETEPEQSDVVVRALPIESPVPEANLASARAWITAGHGLTDPVRTMQLQGSTILHHGNKLVIFSETEERIAKLIPAILEAVYLELQLSQLETELAGNWNCWEADIPMSFQFGERQLHTSNTLAEHHNAVHRLRSRLERLSPAIHAPHVYPPTLASQASERYRERSQLAHRHEVLGEQLQPFEELYESCAQRASDYRIARKGHQLEWAIIILLVIQIIFTSAEILTSLESSTAEVPATLSEPLDDNEQKNK